MAGLPITGEPVGIDDTIDILPSDQHGPYYNERVQNSMKENGVWSDGFVFGITDSLAGKDLFHTVQDAFCSACCPCVVFYQILERTGKVQAGALGALDKRKYALIFTVLCIVYAVVKLLKIPPQIMCHPIPPETELHRLHPSPARMLFEVSASGIARDLLDVPGGYGAASSAVTQHIQDAPAGYGAVSAYAGNTSSTVAQHIQDAPAKVAQMLPKPSSTNTTSGTNLGIDPEAATMARGAWRDFAASGGSDLSKLKPIFDGFDVNKDGSLDTAELVTFAKRTGIADPESHAAQKIQEFDTSGNGNLEFDEVKQSMATKLQNWMANNPQHKPGMKCYNLWTSIMDFILGWLLPFAVFKGVRDKMKVKEPDFITFLKAPCLPNWCCVCQCCFLMQVRRHVDRVQGHTAIEDDRVGLGTGNTRNDEGF